MTAEQWTILAFVTGGSAMVIASLAGILILAKLREISNRHQWLSLETADGVFIPKWQSDLADLIARRIEKETQRNLADELEPVEAHTDCPTCGAKGAIRKSEDSPLTKALKEALRGKR